MDCHARLRCAAATALYSTELGVAAQHISTDVATLRVVGIILLEVIMESTGQFSFLSVKRVRQVTRNILFKSDTATIRAILAISSLFLSVTVMLQYDISPSPLWKVVWAVADKDIWAMAFFLHFIGLSWLFLDPHPRLRWELIINSYGLLIWVASTLVINMSTWKLYATIAPSTALETVVCLFAAWALFRTGQGKELTRR